MSKAVQNEGLESETARSRVEPQGTARELNPKWLLSASQQRELGAVILSGDPTTARNVSARNPMEDGTDGSERNQTHYKE
ncbi:hypothetical protein VTO42DRAFT_6752 [Malbranchea cinnamomea]